MSDLLKLDAASSVPETTLTPAASDAPTLPPPTMPHAEAATIPPTAPAETTTATLPG